MTPSAQVPSTPKLTIEPSYSGTLATALPERVAFYVPSVTSTGKTHYDGISPEDLLRVTANFLTFEFGGATEIKAKGYYVDTAKRAVVEEEVKLIYAYASAKKVLTHLKTIERLANDLCCRFDQTQLAYELGGKLYLATPAMKYRTMNDRLYLREKEGRQAYAGLPWFKYWDIKKLIEQQIEDEKRTKAEADAKAELERKAAKEKRRAAVIAATGRSALPR